MNLASPNDIGAMQKLHWGLQYVGCKEKHVHACYGSADFDVDHSSVGIYLSPAGSLHPDLGVHACGTSTSVLGPQGSQIQNSA